jgi:hypothetical protein
MTTVITIKSHVQTFSNAKTYLMALLFIIGNILLPQLCHLIPKGGLILLPIYFFTFVGAYKYGWKTGLLIAVFSPLINSLIFGMPAAAALPAIMTKSILLAIAAGLAAVRFQKISIPILALVVVSYQIAGTLAEWAFTGDLSLAAQDFRIAIPGMLLQVFGGYAFIRYLMRN